MPLLVNDAEVLYRALTLMSSEELNLASQGLKDDAALVLSSSLATIHLQSNLLSDCHVLVSYLLSPHASSLTFLNLENNRIGEEGCMALSTVLQNNFTITHLNLSNNPMGNKGATALAKMLPKNRGLCFAFVPFSLDLLSFVAVLIVVVVAVAHCCSHCCLC